MCRQEIQEIGNPFKPLKPFNMSKIEAYRCDLCGNPREYDDIYAAIIPIEDAFDKLASYPAKTTPGAIEKGEIHVCTDCCRTKAIIPATNMYHPGRYEAEYKAKLRELLYGVREQCVVNHRARERHKKS